MALALAGSTSAASLSIMSLHRSVLSRYLIIHFCGGYAVEFLRSRCWYVVLAPMMPVGRYIAKYPTNAAALRERSSRCMRSSGGRRAVDLWNRKSGVSGAQEDPESWEDPPPFHHDRLHDVLLGMVHFWKVRSLSNHVKILSTPAGRILMVTVPLSRLVTLVHGQNDNVLHLKPHQTLTRICRILFELQHAILDVVRCDKVIGLPSGL